MKRFLLFLMPVFLTACNIANSEHMRTPEAQQIAQRAIGPSGEYLTTDFDPQKYLQSWNFNDLPEDERAKFYQETTLTDGTLLREYWISIEEKEIEVAPGVFYPAWAYNGQVPGPTIRAIEGDSIKINFTNLSSKPHTMHFHGIHAAKVDGSGAEEGDSLVLPGETFVYEFKAEPFGTHLYHCHSYPVSQHLSHGLYGAYIVDPRDDQRPKADQELVMIMNGFDVNFDGENDFYALNTKAFAYDYQPIKVKAGELVRIYLANLTEFDLLNSFHLHANFFDEYPTGTKMQPTNFTDTIVLAQGERSILDVRFKEPGMFMFHAHVSEFAELGWSGMFEVIAEPPKVSSTALSENFDPHVLNSTLRSKFSCRLVSDTFGDSFKYCL